jgi:hypothetical protein
MAIVPGICKASLVNLGLLYQKKAGKDRGYKILKRDKILVIVKYHWKLPGLNPLKAFYTV